MAGAPRAERIRMRARTPSRPAVRSVLCPVDFSRNAGAALRYAAALARQTGVRLIVLHVADPLLMSAAATAAYDTRALWRRTDRDLRRFASRHIGRAVPPRRVTIAMTLGPAAAEILKAARRHRCDLLVMGRQGLSGPSRWLFGSTTDTVLRRSAVPVTVVPVRRAR